jgi:hypothetical protein
MAKLYLLAPGHKGTSDAYRTGYERIWGKSGVKHNGSSQLRMPLRVESRKLEHFSKADCYVQEQR